jgi:molybdopterin/thiamine biosynthesis adenylyltransferase
MSTSQLDKAALRGKSALLIGVGGLGCPAALALAGAGLSRIVLVDDDRVEESNLHRQILFTDEDVGRDKLSAAELRLQERGTLGADLDLVRTRFLPDNARLLARTVDIVLEGADNFATKFLAADACHLEGTPVVHGAAVRWTATVWAVAGVGQPCYRCLFEDVPHEDAPNCAEAGVVGPVVGLAGALMADLALRVLSGDATPFGSLHTYSGQTDSLRRVEVSPRADCPLCGPSPRIGEIDELRYTAPACTD